ncbi:MAG: cupin domain-containing protein, partial [Planctomycetota bacterium]|nr:cupin domain-containing protein [Planctomycetota bacterium]
LYMKVRRRKSAPQTPEEAVGAERIGARLRKLRLAAGISARELARRAGVTPGFVSHIELGRAEPSLGTLRVLLGELGSSLGRFFAEEEEGEGRREDRVVVRASEMVNIARIGGGIRWLSATAGMGVREFQLMREIYPPGTDTGERAYSHEGVEAGICVRGMVEILVAGVRHIVRKGDGYCFRSAMPHRFRNPGPSTAEVISVNSPASI